MRASRRPQTQGFYSLDLIQCLHKCSTPINFGHVIFTFSHLKARKKYLYLTKRRCCEPLRSSLQCTSAWLSMSENLPGGVGRQGITDRLRPLRRLRPLIHKFFEYYYSYFIAQSDKTRNTFACLHTASEKTFILHHLKIRRNLPPRRVVWSRSVVIEPRSAPKPSL